jgi:hypothetical protein
MKSIRVATRARSARHDPIRAKTLLDEKRPIGGTKVDPPAAATLLAHRFGPTIAKPLHDLVSDLVTARPDRGTHRGPDLAGVDAVVVRGANCGGCGTRHRSTPARVHGGCPAPAGRHEKDGHTIRGDHAHDEAGARRHENIAFQNPGRRPRRRLYPDDGGTVDLSNRDDPNALRPVTAVAESSRQRFPAPPGIR